MTETQEEPIYDGWLFPEPDTKHEDVILDFNYEDYKLSVLWGSVSSGKTVSSAEAWAGLVKRAPKHYPMAMIGKTELTLEANVLDPLTDFLGSDDCYKRGNVAYIYGHKVRLYGANDAKARTKIQGKSLYAWYGDEVTTWPEDFFMMALSRLRVGKAKAIMTMNPEGPFHWFHKQIIERANDSAIRAKLYHFTMDDNPHLPEDYKAWLSAMYAPGTVWYRRWIKGEWAAAEGAVFPFFTDRLEDGFVVDALPGDLCHWLTPVDYGQDHPTVFGLMGYSPSTQKWYGVKEYYTKGKPVPEFSAEYKREILDYNGGIIPESADIDTGGGGLALLIQLRNDYPELDSEGIFCHAIKVDVNAEYGQFGGSLFRHEFVLYRPGCKRSIEEISNLRWKEKPNGGQEEVLKEVDDGPAMWRYGWNRAQRIVVS